jgi:hypothetical protein
MKRFLLPRTCSALGVLCVCLSVPAGIVVFSPVASAQVTNGRFSGTVTDTSGAVIPNAAVTLTNTTNHDIRTTTSNGSGLFNFSGLPSGDYSLSISMAGFQKSVTNGLHLDPGDSRAIPAIQMQNGTDVQTVTVTADNNSIPLDTGERSDLITAEEIKHLAVEGRDVTELFKTLPGFAIAGQGVNNAAYDPSQVSVNGALGSYSANGNPISGVALKLDGANITDPGNYGAAIQNVNYDQVAEVKVQTSNFDAQGSNGPVVVNAVTTAGGDKFHGKLYTYARTSQLDSTDWLSGATGQQKAPDREIYPGFTIGGPVLIPGTNFNHARKFTFFGGAEDYAQRDIYAYGNAAGAIVHALVPTQNMRNGNFSAAELSNYLGGLYAPPGSVAAANGSAFVGLSTQPTIARDGTAIANGMISSAYQDPGFQALYKTMPLPNVPTNVSGQYNWVQTNFVNNDLWQAVGRGDLAISDKNKLFGRYSVERGNSGVPEVPYYSPGQLNTPGGLLSTVNSESAAANLTTVINATTTNQVYGSISYLNQGFVAGNQSALSASALGYPYKGIYPNNGSLEIPQFQTYGAQYGLPLGLFPDLSYGSIFAHKFDPVGGDTFTKVWGHHTASFGTYVERVTNNQRIPGGTTNGALSQYAEQMSTIAVPNPITDGDGTKADLSENLAANDYEGYVASFSQQNLLPDTNLYFWNTDFFATDAYKVVPTVTLTFGLRVEHLGLWNDAHGAGVALFEPSTINSTTLPQPGFLWHSVDSSLPLSGNHSQLAFLEPRLGFAWDISKKGTTVLRGGWGEYRTHDSWNDASNAVSSTEGLHSTSVGGAGISLRAIGLTNLPNNAGGANLTDFALTAGDNEEPLTDTYSITLNQQLPWKISGLIGYVGNNSRFLLDDQSNQTVALDNVNAIPVGTLSGLYPLTGPAGTTTLVNLTTAQINAARPYANFGAIDVPNHVAFSNYNGVQLSATRQTGRILFNVNYTFGKALGIIANPVDPFHLYSNYGVESFDRSQIFNATYTFMVGNPIKNRLIGGATNGWEISGITTYQSGADLQTSVSNPNFALGGTIGPPGGTQTYGVSSITFLGTPDVSLQPETVCSPRSGLATHQYINGACFRLPAMGQNGPAFYPYLHGPAYFDSDLSAQKAFSFPHEQSLQLRFAAFNFLNHPLTSFTGNFTNETTLSLNNSAVGATPQSAVYDPTSRFGFADYKEGRRVVEVSLKYSF